MRIGTATFVFIILVGVFVHLAACSQSPATPFAVGAEVPPPAGCADLRKRGGAC